MVSNVFRPKVLVDISSGSEHLPFSVVALLDSGCDITIIPEEFAEILKLKKLAKTDLVAYRETTKVNVSKVDITFIGKAQRENIKLSNIPVLITPLDKHELSPEVVIGVRGIFDQLNIKFNLASNRIELKRVDNLKRKIYY